MTRVPAIETAKEAAKRLARPMLEKGFKPEALHTYTDPAGQPIYWRIRAKHPEGEKWIRPMHRNGRGFELGEPAFEGAKPLYRLHELASAADGAIVFIVEGEKPVDALDKRGVLATTSGGADSARKADWSPLKRLQPILWRDNDLAGENYQHDVLAELRALGISAKVIDVPALGLPEKGDAVEWLAAHPEAMGADVLALPALEATRAATAPEGMAGKPACDNALQKATVGQQAATVGQQAEPSIELVSGANVELEAVTWLWRDWLAAGALHMLAGAPGTGKTTLALALIATVTSGGRWPDGSRAEPGDAVIWSGEDSIENTLAPRLKACGADLGRVQFVRRTFDQQGAHDFDPATDMPLLREALAGRAVRLVVLDPIVSAVTGDSHKATEVRRSLQPVRDLAEALKCAVLGISHYTKGTAGRDPVERVTGSVAFGAVPRLVFGAAKMPEEDGGGRIFVRAKNNLGPDTGGFRYDLEQVDVCRGIFASRVLWGDAQEGTARELLAKAEASAEGQAGGTIATACDFLRDLLADGPLSAKQVKSDCDGAGYAWRTAQEAADRIGVERRKAGMREGWQWALPKAQGATKAHEDASTLALRLRASSGDLASSADSIVGPVEAEV